MGTYCITGSASGIGAGIAARLQEDGHDVLTVDVNNADIEADLATTEGRTRAAAAILERSARGLDGFIPCAGIGGHMEPRSLIPKVNYFGAVVLTEALRPKLSESRGRVVLISSNSSRMGDAHPTFVEKLLAGDEPGAADTADGMNGQSVYADGKFALAVWMRRNSADYIADGVRMNAIAPGYISTPLTEAITADPTYGPAIKAFVESIPVGRPGIPKDIADAAAWLLSPETSFICGSVLYVDGGHDAMLRPDSY